MKKSKFLTLGEVYQHPARVSSIDALGELAAQQKRIAVARLLPQIGERALVAKAAWGAARHLGRGASFPDAAEAGYNNVFAWGVVAQVAGVLRSVDTLEGAATISVNRVGPREVSRACVARKVADLPTIIAMMPPLPDTYDAEDNLLDAQDVTVPLGELGFSGDDTRIVLDVEKLWLGRPAVAI